MIDRAVQLNTSGSFQNKQPTFQKKIIKDDSIGDFFLKISKLENYIFDQLNEAIDNDISLLEKSSISIMIKFYNSLLDTKRKQLEIRKITNYFNESKKIKFEYEDY